MTDYDDDDEFELGSLVDSLDDHVAAVMSDEKHIRLVVKAAHIAALFTVYADRARDLNIGQRAQIYNHASALLCASVTGDVEGIQIARAGLHGFGDPRDN